MNIWERNAKRARRRVQLEQLNTWIEKHPMRAYAISLLIGMVLAQIIFWSIRVK
jgi:predicted membrane protein